MRYIEISKGLRSGIKNEFLVIDNDDLSEVDIDELVDYHCQYNIVGGEGYGYQFQWKFIYDEAIIENILKEEIQKAIKIINEKFKEKEIYLKELRNLAIKNDKEDAYV